jgi:hypothetical protein
MRVQLGITLDGRTAALDTNTPSVTLLLADPGQGKTTLVRYLARWWLARSDMHVTVVAHRPHEWADLAAWPGLTLRDSQDAPVCAGSPPSTRGRTAQYPRQLTILDGVDAPGLGRLPGVLGARELVVATAVNSWLAADVAEATRADTSVYRWGLLPFRASRQHAGERALVDQSLDPWQGRLDWGAKTQPLWAHRRGPRDFPCHAWAHLQQSAAAGQASAAPSPLTSPVRSQRRMRR